MGTFSCVSVSALGDEGEKNEARELAALFAQNAQ